MSDCSVPCKVSWDELEALCRRERVYCKQLGVNRANVNEYEVEFLCDYKKTKVRYRGYSTGHCEASIHISPGSGCKSRSWLVQFSWCSSSSNHSETQNLDWSISLLIIYLQKVVPLMKHSVVHAEMLSVIYRRTDLMQFLISITGSNDSSGSFMCLVAE